MSFLLRVKFGVKNVFFHCTILISCHSVLGFDSVVCLAFRGWGVGSVNNALSGSRYPRDLKFSLVVHFDKR